MKSTLLILAAGMGSRYGALKQMDAFGPNGEAIIDYSIYDAINAGFDKIVFIVRSYFKDEMEKMFRERIGDRIEMVFVEQELHMIPDGFVLNPEREKPWGTAHAVLVAKDVIDGPFAIINADDYYGQESYTTVMDFFKSNEDDTCFSVVSYLLKNTLSDHGTVNRGVCYKDANGDLTKIVETLKIGRDSDGSIKYPKDDGEGELSPDTLVSMNMFGFYPSYFDIAGEYFKTFLEEEGQELKSEFFIPLSLDKMINSNQGRVNVLTSPASWFGVTYKDDKPIVMEKISTLIKNGVYPENLWA